MIKKRISIIIPAYKPNIILLNRLKKYIKENTNKEFETIILDGVGGLAHTYNRGIKKAKGEIIITIHSDCVPLEKDSLKKLIKPFENPSVVLSYSKILQEDTKESFYPHVPDGKLTAFRKSALEQIKLFDEKTFFTGGEDVDIYLKLKKIGQIVRVDTLVLHTHPNYLGNKTLDKRRQNGEINGALFRIWGIKNPKWFKALTLCLKYPRTYGKYFIKSFFSKNQGYRRY